MRLIDAEEFERRMRGVYEEYMWDVLEEMPTVDAVKVVRCKDCAYYNGNNHYCDFDHYAIFNGYCYNGVRKDMTK